MGKRILDIDGSQTKQNSGEELIAFGEATVEDIGMGPERNPRTVTNKIQGKNLLLLEKQQLRT